MKIETRAVQPQGVDLVEIARTLYGRSTDKSLRTARISVTLPPLDQRDYPPTVVELVICMADALDKVLPPEKPMEGKQNRE